MVNYVLSQQQSNIRNLNLGSIIAQIARTLETDTQTQSTTKIKESKIEY